MPYVSKPEKERAKWMPIADAVRHIRGVDRCTHTKAVKQLFAALRDKAIDCCWADMKPPSWGPSTLITYSDSLPNPSAWRAPKLIMRRGGLVKFDSAEPARPLLLLREHVLKIWPYPAASAEHGVGATTDLDDVRRMVSKSDLRKWYEGRVAECKSRDEMPSRDDDEQAARIHFKALTVPRKWLRCLRTELAPEKWRKPGPTPQT